MQAQQKATLPATLKVVVLRAFQMSGGKVVPAKAEVELPRAFALDLAHSNKVRVIEEPKTEPAAAVAAGKGAESRKGDSHAR